MARYQDSSFTVFKARQGKTAMAKTATKTAKKAVVSNKQALASAKDTVKRPAQRGEVFGASLPKSEPTMRMNKHGAITGDPPPRGSR